MISAVVPARNEQATVRSVVEALKNHPKIGEVIVVNSASDDDTPTIAAASGAKVVHCAEPGLGRAMKLGISSSIYPIILRTDADIRNWNPNWIDLLSDSSGKGLRRGIFSSPYDTFPVSNLVVRPFFKLYKPEWDLIPLPLTGTYLFPKADFSISALPDSWAIDIAILTTALTRPNYSITNVDIGTLDDARRPISHYIPMASDIHSYLCRFFFPEIAKAYDPKSHLGK